MARNASSRDLLAPQTPVELPRVSTAPSITPPVHWLTYIAKRYPGVLAATDRLRALRNGEPSGWPDHYYIPYIPLHGLLMQNVGRRPSDPMSLELFSDLDILSAMAAWRVTQGIYRFDPTVYEALLATPVTGDLPTELLRRMPEWCVYLETPGLRWEQLPIHGVFTHLWNDDRGYEKLMVLLNSGTTLTICPIVLDHRTLEETIRYTFECTSAAGVFVRPEFERNMPVVLPRILSLLLYLCSEAAEIGNGVIRPSRPAPKRTKKGVRMFAAQAPVCWDVATRLGAALRGAEHSANGDGTSSHAGPRPHIRRAHWHTYLSGPRDSTVRTLRWMPPIPVKVETPADLIPTMHPVGTDASH